MREPGGRRRRFPAALKWVAAIVAFCALVLLFLALFDWNLLRGPIGRFASERAGRPVRIEGTLQAQLLSLTPQVEVSRLVVGNPPWAGSGNFAEVERATVALDLRRLLAGELVLARLELRQPRLDLYRDAAGRANWVFRDAAEQREQPVRLPAVRRFVVTQGKLRLRDEPRRLRLEGTVFANEQLAGRDATPFGLAAQGEINREPFRLRVDGGPLLNVEPDEPYPFIVQIRAGATRADARGSIPRPFDLGAVQAAVRVSGEDLADLYYLTGLALPNTPPYAVSGHLRREGARLAVRRLEGKVGDSDVSGALLLETAGERPVLRGELTSRRLDLDDLAAPLGAAPSTRAAESASPAQKASAKKMAARRRLLPDAPLELERLHVMDAAVRFRAGAVQAARMPVREVAMDLRLEEGVLILDPVRFTLPQGRLAGAVRIDAREKKVAATQLDMRISGVSLEQFFARQEGPAPIEGTLQGRIRLQGRGNSVHDFASGAAGSITVVVPQGAVREAFAELTGVNVARGLGLLLRDDQEQTAVRCGVADFRVRDGSLLARTLVFDTDDVLITGEGTLDLESEGVDFEIQGRPKEVRFGRVRAPITIRGPLRKPDIGLRGGEAAAQAGIAAALGALVAPLASVLAFVDPGLADDANCAGLLAEARGKGTPTAAGARKSD